MPRQFSPARRNDAGWLGHELLAELEAALRSGGPAMVQAMTGIGGIGKSTAAIEFAHRHHEQFDIAWWVPGLINQEIAAHLTVSPHTVKTHVNRTMTKLHAHDRVGAGHRRLRSRHRPPRPVGVAARETTAPPCLRDFARRGRRSNHVLYEQRQTDPAAPAFSPGEDRES
jgi:DNA-binding CsgD family transcriptional regulator